MTSNINNEPDNPTITHAIDSARSLASNDGNIETIKEELSEILNGHRMGVVTFDPGMTLCSIYGSGKPTNTSEIVYSKDQLAPIGITSRTEHPMLFCHPDREAAIFQSRPQHSDTISIVHWVTTSTIRVISFGYSQDVFDRIGSSRALPEWARHQDDKHPAEYEEVSRFLSDIFIQSMLQNGQRKYDKITLAIAEMLTGAEGGDGLVYPSVIMQSDADNFILSSRAVEKHLRFVKAENIRIDAIRDSEYDIKILDSAREIGDKGIIEWYSAASSGRTKRYGTVGWEEFLRQKKDILSAYDSAKESNANRPVKTEHGTVAEASFRKWISDYLPKKFAVTSGFVIPDERKMNYIIRHYDVIIYDALNAPVLWVSNNPDDSEQGRSRAIPAKYVHAVFEVKARLTGTSIDSAVNKLKELKSYQDHLPKHFVSGTIFFEVARDEQKTSALINSLFNDDIPGYFGGIILRAEGIDDKITGYIKFTDHTDEADKDMPLVREISEIRRNNEGGISTKERGDTIFVVKFDDILNYDIGYSVSAKKALLHWSYNSFPLFSIDLLERLSGTYDPANSLRNGSYGLSFVR
jgi:hypothetical protein